MHGGQVISAQAAQTARQPNSHPATTKDGARGPRGEREGRSNSKEGQDNSDAWKTSDKRASSPNSAPTKLTSCHNQGRCERSKG
jgi:hypothetical protein